MSLSNHDSPTGAYTSAIPSGTAAFRKVIGQAFGYSRTEVVRDRPRCDRQRSEHCECGACDFFTTDVAKGRKLFDWCVRHADRLGIQSVIFNRRVVGFGRPTERRYTGDSPHTDHVHVGLNRHARTHLTEQMVRDALDAQGEEEEDWFDMATKAELEALLKPLKDDINMLKEAIGVGQDYAKGTNVLKCLMNREKKPDGSVKFTSALNDVLDLLKTQS
jgi:hypothetical protein